MTNAEVLIEELENGGYFKNGIYTQSTHPDWENTNHYELMNLLAKGHSGYTISYQINHDVYDWTITRKVIA